MKLQLHSRFGDTVYGHPHIMPMSLQRARSAWMVERPRYFRPAALVASGFSGDDKLLAVPKVSRLIFAPLMCPIQGSVPCHFGGTEAVR